MTKPPRKQTKISETKNKREKRDKKIGRDNMQMKFQKRENGSSRIK